ncbi:MAG: hypothetical protein EA382_17380 [Spirochaetaceae bacterium]|nr:MAG: hypothetical protein EA382_17380 [Spirochaetaceae bacterium]
MSVVVLAGCVSRKLAERPIEGEPVRIVVRVAPDARVKANYSVTIDANDPVGSIISIGTTAAKADQAFRAQQRMDAAMRNLDLARIIDDELSSFYSDALDMPVVDSARDATYTVNVRVREYGIDAGRAGSSIRFVLKGRVEMFDPAASDRIWRYDFSEEQRVSPALFGLPTAAGNVFTAAMLADLDEQEIAAGIERVARTAAWSIGDRFQRDLYRQRRR